MAGKSTVITGGGVGIGARMAQSFAEAGAAKVGLIARRESTLQQVKDKLQASHPQTEGTGPPTIRTFFSLAIQSWT